MWRTIKTAPLFYSDNRQDVSVTGEQCLITEEKGQKVKKRAKRKREKERDRKKREERQEKEKNEERK